MRLRLFAPLAILVAVPSVCLAGNTYVKPTTTLAAQSANNSSAASNFKSQTNGNRGAGNISRVDVHNMLYPGATTKIYAHMMVWFGQSNHMNVGYSSTDTTQIKNQINDMISRGIDGVIIDWYGPNNSKDQATLSIMAEAAGVWQNAIPKQGGDTFHGMVFGNFSNDSLQSTGNVSDATKASTLPRNWDFNPAIGGPLKKEKLWFFGLLVSSV